MSMRDKLRNTPETLFVFAGFLLILALLSMVSWRNSSAPPSDLFQYQGRIARIEHTNTSKIGRWVHIYFQNDNFSIVYEEDLGHMFPTLNELRAGDLIVARVRPDVLERNQGSPWEIKRGNEAILAYDQMESRRIEGNIGVPQWALATAVVAGLLVVIGIAIRTHFGVNSSEATAGVPIALVHESPSPNLNLQSTAIDKRPLPSWLGPGLQAYGLFAYILTAWALGLHLSAIETALESGAGYFLAKWWMRKMDSRSTQLHPAVIILGFLLLHACLACIIDRRLAVWLIWYFLKLKHGMTSSYSSMAP